MSTEHPELPDAVRASWHRFADTYEPFRGALYRYCRHLTRSPWDAEDLALHRGRGKLLAPDNDASRVPTRAVVDAFCAAFNAHDVERLTALLLDSATVEVVGATASYGADETRGQMLRGMLFGSERLANAATKGGIEARFVCGALPTPPRAETRIHRGEAIALLWYAHADGEHVRAINRIEADGERIASLRNYFLTPDSIAEICAELGISQRANGHRWWLSREGCP